MRRLLLYEPFRQLLVLRIDVRETLLIVLATFLPPTHSSNKSNSLLPPPCIPHLLLPDTTIHLTKPNPPKNTLCPLFRLLQQKTRQPLPSLPRPIRTHPCNQAPFIHSEAQRSDACRPQEP